MTLKEQLEKIMKLSFIMSIIHLILGIYNIIIVYGIGIGIGSIISAYSSFQIYLHSKNVVVRNQSFKEELFFILKNLLYYLIGVLIILIGVVIMYFIYKSYLNNFFANIIY